MMQSKRTLTKNTNVERVNVISVKKVNKATEKAKMNKKRTNVVQVQNPRTGRYVKINKDKGRIVAHKKSDGPFKNVPIQINKSKGAKE